MTDPYDCCIEALVLPFRRARQRGDLFTLVRILRTTATHRGLAWRRFESSVLDAVETLARPHAADRLAAK